MNRLKRVRLTGLFGGSLLKITIDDKVAKTLENVDWESCRTKCSDILDLFVTQYLCPEEMISTLPMHKQAAWPSG